MTEDKEELVTRYALAEILEVHPRTTFKWQREGMPVARPAPSGGTTLFRIGDVEKWLQKREGEKLDEAQTRAQRNVSLTRLTDQKREIIAGKLLSREDIVQAWAAEITAARAILWSMPSHYAARVFREALSTKEVGAVERVLEEVAREVMSELGDPERDTESVPSPDEGGGRRARRRSTSARKK